MNLTSLKRFSLSAFGLLLMAGGAGAAVTHERVHPHDAGKHKPVSRKARAAEDPVASLMAPRVKTQNGDFRTFPSRRAPGSLGQTSWKPANMLPLPSKVTSAEAARIYGGAIFSDAWTAENQAVGIYSFEKNDGSTLRGEAVGDDWVVTGGGVYANGKYHFVSYMNFMGMVLANMYTCDISDWQIERALPVKAGAIAQDMAYDPTTGNVYGCFMNDDADGWVMGVLDIESGTRRKLVDLDMIILTVAVNSKGEVYGIGLDGNLYRFDKETGARTLIGHTGRQPMYSASGCFDLETDIFYWECIEANAKGCIYTVDTTTGETTYLTTVAQNMEMTGMFIPVAEAADAAPAAVTVLDTEFEGDNLEGYVVFTMPEKRFDGEGRLDGTLSYTLSVNEIERGSGEAAPGEIVKVPVTVAAPGTYRVSVVVSNEAGASPIRMSQFWIGEDLPVSPASARLVKGEFEGQMVLSWDAPSETVHGGYVDADAITYDVVRMPDGEVKAEGTSATVLTDEVDPLAELTSYWYEITPRYKEIALDTFTSNRVGMGVARLPYYNGLDTEDNFRLFTVVDANGDGETWVFDPISSSARMKYSSANNWNEPMDDWLMSPAFTLEPGRMYRFTMRARSYDTTYPERIEVKAGAAPTPEGMTMTVVEPLTVAGWETPMLEGYVCVETPGLYYFGIHACSKADTFYLYADEVMVEEGPRLGAPAVASNLKAEAGANGALEATLTFTLPSTDVTGNPIETLDNVEIYRDDRLIATEKAGTPGQQMSYTDTHARNGDNTYAVVCTNANGGGFEAKTTIYVGHDRPGLPVNVHAAISGNDVVLTWEAPEGSENGGYYDPAALTYTVLRANDEVELATGLTELTFTDHNPPLNGFRQEFYGYYIYAESPGGYGYGQISNIVAVGEPFPMPFVETFAGGEIVNDPWDVQKPDYVEGNWVLRLEGQYPDVQSQDPDGGLVSFVPEEGEDNATLTSGMIDFTGATAPFAEFWWYDTENAFDTITLYVIPDGGAPVRMAAAALSTLPDGPCWRKTSVDLSRFIGCKFIQLCFEARSAFGYTNIHLDNIRVKNRYEDNVTVGTLTAPERMRAYTEYEVKVNVENSGVNPSAPFEVCLLCDGKVIASESVAAMQPDEVRPVVFSVTPDFKWSEDVVLQARADYEADKFVGDNLSNEVPVNIILPSLPYVESLDGRLDEEGNVVLEWDEPVMPDVKEGPVTDDVENYATFSIRNFGEWLTVDVDKQNTYGIAGPGGGMLGYPNAGTPMAFMVFNPAAVGIDVEDGAGEPTAWAPHSGDQVFASFAAENTSNDDWLISPMLPGIAQTVSFYVKSLTAEYGFEKYEVYYSTGGTSVSDFIRIGDLRSAPIVWDEVKIDLPEGARYFAIRCVSDDCYIFMVDDLTFVSVSNYPEELSLVGYNVYRDGELLNVDEPVADPMYVDKAAPAGKHIYTVTAVYDKGESRFSKGVSVAVSGIGGIEGLRVLTEPGTIVVSGAEGLRLRVADTAGRVIADLTAAPTERIEVAPGVYTLTVGRDTVKVIVR
ncbi:MAG: choice-of-anchor J domain-containing protein [Muribaculaceae bacterium]|nr:choice-of-anchor J domain-containing protein [Muribaculaceae bacterium]